MTNAPPRPGFGSHRLLIPSSEDGTLQPSCVHIPESIGDEPAAVLICLHGMGADESTWFAATPVRELAGRHGFVVACPYGRGNLFYRGIAEQDVHDLVDWLLAVGLADARRLFVVGHSMGGFGAWRLGLGSPDRFAGIFPWSGFHPPGELAAGWHLGAGIVHSVDDDIVDVAWSQAAAEELDRRESEHDLHLCEGYGHSSRMIGDWLEAAVESMLIRRLESQPLEVRLAGRHPLRLCAWWLASLGVGGGVSGEVMELEAQILRPWEHRLSPEDAACPYALVRIFGVPAQAVALQAHLLTRAAGGPAVVELTDGTPNHFVRVLGSSGRTLLLVPQETNPAPKNLDAFDVRPASPEWLLLDGDGSHLGTAVDRRAVARLARERLLELGPRPARLARLQAATPDERLNLLETWMLEAAHWGLEDHPTWMVLPEGALWLPTEGPIGPLQLLESYVRPEELLGVYRFPTVNDLNAWMVQSRPFPLRSQMIPGEEQPVARAVTAVIPLALVPASDLELAGGPRLMSAAGFDGLVPGSDEGQEWSGPGTGWPLGLEGQIITPGMLALSGVLGAE